VVLLSAKVGIVALAFGTPAEIQANRQIASAAVGDAGFYNVKHIYTQPDIKIEVQGLSVEYIEEQPGKPSPTLRIARGAVQWALRMGFNKLLLEAAPDHQWRVLRDFRKAVAEAGAAIDVALSQSPDNFFTEDSWYGDSTQPRTQSREAFMKRETKLQKAPWWLYKLMTWIAS
jgi:hypothetical protein